MKSLVSENPKEATTKIYIPADARSNMGAKKMIPLNQAALFANAQNLQIAQEASATRERFESGMNYRISKAHLGLFQQTSHQKLYDV
jgi:hypothetical protein